MVAKVNFDVTAAIEEIEILNNQKVSEEKNWCWIGKLTMLHSNISIFLSNLKIILLIVDPTITYRGEGPLFVHSSAGPFMQPSATFYF